MTISRDQFVAASLWGDCPVFDYAPPSHLSLAIRYVLLTRY